MKKTVTNPDGSTEVVEGTAEEIAAYERALKQKRQDESKRKPGVLKGISPEEIGELVRLLAPKIQEEVQKNVWGSWQYWTFWPTKYVTDNKVQWRCNYCGRSDCNGTHVYLDQVSTAGTTVPSPEDILKIYGLRDYPDA